jgi:hypothetical protein
LSNAKSVDPEIRNSDNPLQAFAGFQLGGMPPTA